MLKYIQNVSVSLDALVFFVSDLITLLKVSIRKLVIAITGYILPYMTRVSDGRR